MVTFEELQRNAKYFTDKGSGLNGTKYFHGNVKVWVNCIRLKML